MAIDLNKFAGKAFDEAAMAEVEAELAQAQSRTDAAEAKARAAAQESINGRKTLNANLALAYEKLGVSSAEELAALPDAKGQADAIKQFEVQLKRAMRERDDALAQHKELEGRWSASRREAAVDKALASQQWADADSARLWLSSRVHAEGEDFLFKADGDKLMSMADGAAWLAKTKPNLVPAAAAGATGSGFKSGAAGAGGGGNTGAPTLDMAAIYAARASAGAPAGAAAAAH